MVRVLQMPEVWMASIFVTGTTWMLWGALAERALVPVDRVAFAMQALGMLMGSFGALLMVSWEWKNDAKPKVPSEIFETEGLWVGNLFLVGTACAAMGALLQKWQGPMQKKEVLVVCGMVFGLLGALMCDNHNNKIHKMKEIARLNSFNEN